MRNLLYDPIFTAANPTLGAPEYGRTPSILDAALMMTLTAPTLDAYNNTSALQLHNAACPPHTSPKPRRLRFPVFPNPSVTPISDVHAEGHRLPASHKFFPKDEKSFHLNRSPRSFSHHRLSRSVPSLPQVHVVPAVPRKTSLSHIAYTPRLPSLDEEPLPIPSPALADADKVLAAATGLELASQVVGSGILNQSEVDVDGILRITKSESLSRVTQEEELTAQPEVSHPTPFPSPPATQTPTPTASYSPSFAELMGHFPPPPPPPTKPERPKRPRSKSTSASPGPTNPITNSLPPPLPSRAKSTAWEDSRDGKIPSLSPVLAGLVGRFPTSHPGYEERKAWYTRPRSKSASACQDSPSFAELLAGLPPPPPVPSRPRTQSISGSSSSPAHSVGLQDSPSFSELIGTSSCPPYNRPRSKSTCGGANQPTAPSCFSPTFAELTRPLPPPPPPATIPREQEPRPRAKSTSASAQTSEASKKSRRTKSMEKIKPLFMKSVASLAELSAPA
ncbi:hypothetical protein OE88DRAFT_1127737 [Heliocybe sulcata]|uniref:Uncharacterized protein n=1 Tax=Heliocybe sulcata TaxID=5364 RepID=A0A5C3N940_9AGAM|nr:hypothetical protein OE88DRAFT_1127737 [Heliocybe sulcata]